MFVTLVIFKWQDIVNSSDKQEIEYDEMRLKIQYLQ